MGFTVTHTDHAVKSEQFQDYDRLLNRRLVARKLDLAAVPRSQDPVTGHRWLFVWDDERDAQEFATALQQETADPGWIVTPVASPPWIGPLRPIEIDATVRSDGYVFALAPWARTALQAKLPDSCRMGRVVVGYNTATDFQSTLGNLGPLSREVLLMLTGLSGEQLAPFEHYLVPNPATGETLVPPTPIQSGAGGAGGA